MKISAMRLAILGILLMAVHQLSARVLSQKIKSNVLQDTQTDLDKYFNDDEIESALQRKSYLRTKRKRSLHLLQGSKKIMMKGNTERQLRQLKNHNKNKITKRKIKSRSKFLEVEFKNTGKTKGSRVSGQKMNVKRIISIKNKKLRKLSKQHLLGKMVQRIRAKAQKKHLKIKRVLLGEQVKHLFKDSKMAKQISKFLGMKNLKGHIRKLEKRIKSEKRKLKSSANHKANQQKLSRGAVSSQPINPKKHRGLAGMPSSSSSMSGGASAGGKSDNLMKFNFLPGFAGMPFPPFMMNGPHFHPPLNVTVNSLPNPNPRAELDPKEIEQENVKTQLKALNPIDDKLNHVLREIASISKESSVNLEDKYQRVLQLNS